MVLNVLKRRQASWKVLSRIALYGLFLAPLIRFAPWYIFIPVGILVVILHHVIESQVRWRRYHNVIDGIRHTQSTLLPEIVQGTDRDPDRILYKLFKELVSELERKNFQLVEKNIQLLSIKEIGITLVSSVDEKKIIDAVINFLSKGLGYREFFVGIYQDEQRSFNFYTFRDTAGSNRYEETTLGIDDVDGLLKRSILKHQPLLIRDPEMHKIGTLKGKDIFEESTMSSYLVVPLCKSNATQECGFKDDCILKMNQIEKERVSAIGEYTCPACGRIPILGVLGVTDGFKAASLSKVDLVSVETLAVQLSAMLENTQLFQELRQAETFRENVINSMMNGLITVDIDGRIKLANETAAKLSGYSATELMGTSVSDLISSKPTVDKDNPIMKTLKTGRRSYQKEAWLKKKDGSTDPILVNTTFLYDESKRIQGILAVFIDITRIKRMEEQIVHLDKLAALGRFSSSIAHEIRNPLTGIAAGIQYLKRSGKVADDQHENISFILQEVDRIDRLIGDLMNVVREGDLIYEPVNIGDIIEKTIIAMRELAEQETVTVEATLPGNSRTVSVDSDRITQVVLNLVKNAIEACQPGGHVGVTVSYSEDVRDVLFDAVQDFVIIEVKDNGVGLDDEDRNRIFEPFFSKKAGGTGLGLYVTHNIIERHGGYINIDSKRRVGTVISVYLPVARVQDGNSSEISNPAGR